MATVGRLQAVRNCQIIQVQTAPPRTVIIQLDPVNYPIVAAWGNADWVRDDGTNQYTINPGVAPILNPPLMLITYSW